MTAIPFCGVEVYVEPKTAVTETSVVLVAHDGEFTRRRIASPQAARTFAHDQALPIYDATVVGYPQRMEQIGIYSNGDARQAYNTLEAAAAGKLTSTANSVRTGTPVPPRPV